jgi:hypothetical protein
MGAKNLASTKDQTPNCPALVSFHTDYTILAYIQWVMDALSLQGTVPGHEGQQAIIFIWS